MRLLKPEPPPTPPPVPTPRGSFASPSAGLPPTIVAQRRDAGQAANRGRSSKVSGSRGTATSTNTGFWSAALSLDLEPPPRPHQVIDPLAGLGYNPDSSAMPR